jgi:transposase-like protein
MTKIGLKTERIKSLREVLDTEAHTKLALLKNRLEIDLILIDEILEDEVRQYTGERYSHNKPNNGRYSRWGSNPGSVWVGEEKVNIDVPRIYDKKERRNKTLENYEKLKEIEPDEERLMKAILYGLSTNNYKAVVEQFIEGRGLSRSKVSQRFIEESTKRLEEFSNRDLSENKYIAVFIDGKYFYKEQIVIALGITAEGRKVALGFVQTTTENSTSIKQLLSNIIARGLKYEDGLLFVIDGSTGLRKAVEDTFGKYAVIQRCQWHKRENVLSYLNEKYHDIYKTKLNSAYNAETYEEALKRLTIIYNELSRINRNAANSLQEGLEETLTLHRLGLHEDFKQSFSTTNIIESLNSQIGNYTRKVKYWKSSDQRQRWIAVSLLEVEQKMHRVNNYKNLYKFQEIIKQEVQRKLNE